jgi:flagellar hook assembly protein FlgD
VIQYDLPEKSKVKLTIYDLAGRQVRSLVNESQAPGLKTIVWDARDGMGNKMGAGVYIYQLKTDNYIDSKKMILVK